MPDPDQISTLLLGALLPLLACVVLVAFWRRGYFAPGYLRAGPPRRLHLPGKAWLVCVSIALVHPALSLLSLAVGGGHPAAGEDDVVYPTTVLQTLRDASPLLAPALFLALAFAWPHGAQRLGILRPGIGRSLLDGLLIAVPAAALALGLNSLAGMLGHFLGAPPPEMGHQILIELRQDKSPAKITVVFIAAVVYAPLVEELAYRGFAQTVLGDRLGRHRRWLTVVIVGSLFAVMHLPVVPWHALPGLVALGIIWGALYERSGSIWGPITAHAAFNAINLTIVMLMPAPTTSG